jgi:hypothetical protein
MAISSLKSGVDDADIHQIMAKVEAQVNPYRQRMSGEQLAEFGKQQLARELLEHFALPRLSMFYMR